MKSLSLVISVMPRSRHDAAISASLRSDGFSSSRCQPSRAAMAATTRPLSAKAALEGANTRWRRANGSNTPRRTSRAASGVRAPAASSCQTSTAPNRVFLSTSGAGSLVETISCLMRRSKARTGPWLVILVRMWPTIVPLSDRLSPQVLHIRLGLATTILSRSSQIGSRRFTRPTKATSDIPSVDTVPLVRATWIPPASLHAPAERKVKGVAAHLAA